MNHVEVALDVIDRTLSGEHDPLLACRKLIDLRLMLPNNDSDAWDFIMAVDSEMDGVPLGSERSLWAPQALLERDRRTDDYRMRVGSKVYESLKTLRELIQ